MSSVPKGEAAKKGWRPVINHSLCSGNNKKQALFMWPLRPESDRVFTPVSTLVTLLVQLVTKPSH